MSTTSTIWMGDIEPGMKEQDIMNCFLKLKIKPQSVKLIKDKKTNENRNYCFIYFKTIKEASSVLFKLNGKKIPGYTNVFRLNWANCHSSYNKSAYVGNLNPEVDDIKLYNLFKKRYPTVHHASVVTDNGVSKGYGFVIFNGKEEYEKCLKEMNGINFYGNILKVREQKKKFNNDDNSSSKNGSEKSNEEQFNNNVGNINNNIKNFNNINNINNSIVQSIPIININNNIINNKNLLNNNNNIFNNIYNNQINKGINNVRNIPFSNINNNNEILFNCNIVNDRNQYSTLNTDIGTKYSQHLNVSNNSIGSLNSINSEQMSNFSTAEKLSYPFMSRKDDLEILKSLDEHTINQKIHESLKKIYGYFKENPFHGDKKIKSKLI